MRVQSFPPIARSDARVLVLGSMPGVASLEAGEYYAHPQNVFWKIMGELVGAGRDLPYNARAKKLMDNRIALWDVMQSCVRLGSGDAEIVEDSIVPNDFATFFTSHPKIGRVYFNGGKAEQTYRRHVLPHVDRELGYHRLPSTSPAHASLSFKQKFAAWRVVIE